MGNVYLSNETVCLNWSIWEMWSVTQFVFSSECPINQVITVELAKCTLIRTLNPQSVGSRKVLWTYNKKLFCITTLLSATMFCRKAK